MGLTLKSCEFFLFIESVNFELRSAHTVIRTQIKSLILIALYTDVPLWVIERYLSTSDKSVLSVENRDNDWLRIIKNLDIKMLVVLRSWSHNWIRLLCLASLLHYNQVLSIIREQATTLNSDLESTFFHTMRSLTVVAIFEISMHLITDLIKFAQLRDNLTLLMN